MREKIPGLIAIVSCLLSLNVTFMQNTCWAQKFSETPVTILTHDS